MNETEGLEVSLEFGRSCMNLKEVYISVFKYTECSDLQARTHVPNRVFLSK